MKLLDRAKAIWKLFTSGNMTRMDKLILVAALLYCLSPVDIIPDVAPVVGFLDDLVVFLAALRHFSNRVKTDDSPPIHVETKTVDAEAV